MFRASCGIFGAVAGVLRVLMVGCRLQSMLELQLQRTAQSSRIGTHIIAYKVHHLWGYEGMQQRDE